MSREQPLPIVKVGLKEIDALLARVEALLVGDDFKLIKELLYAYLTLVRLVRERGTTIARLRQLFGLSGSEKLARLRDEAEQQAPPPEAAAQGDTSAPEAGADSGDTGPSAGPDDNKDTGTVAGAGEAPKPADELEGKKKVKGHGRVPASAYVAATHIAVPHESLHAGAPCPCGCGGHVYRLDPSTFVRIFGQAPLLARIWDCEQWRCATCGKVYTARAPEQAQGPKYDETASSMIAIQRYGTGMPFHRMDRLQRDLETPVPASTQWDVVKERVEMVRPAYEELVRLAAQGSVLHNDDSYMRVLSFMGKRRAALLKKGELPDPERTGLFTTAIVSIDDARPAIALFFTGRKHAGENLEDVLDQRSDGLPPPIQMGDALTRNVPDKHAVVESNCLAHGRRKIFDERHNYPTECRDLLGKLSRVYAVDDLCRQRKLSPQARLEEHKCKSGPLMDEIKRSMEEQIAQKRVEPNSGIGEAFHYFLKRWDNFTLFLREPGAPLDNNICERALKKAIQHRKGSLFYRSERGAGVGDIYMSLIYTAELHGDNPFDYLTALQRHHKAVAQTPAEWLPWNYQETLARMGVRDPPRPGTRRPTTTRAPPSPDVTQQQAA
jgi:transposase